jgi:hypothetical protein
MRRVHLALGLAASAAFLITGQLIRFHQPPVASLTAETRLLLRSRHIYILAAGLVNLALGLYLQPRRPGWRRIAQTAGSVLIAAAPAFLVAAFIQEPPQGFYPEMPWTHAGLYLLFAGSMLHLLAIEPH